MSNTDTTTDTTYVRRRFTLTKEVNEKLQQLAADYAGDNESRLIRQAIREKHERPSHYEIRVQLQLIIDLLEDLTEEDDESASAPSDQSGDRFPQQSNYSSADDGKSGAERNPARTGRKILQQLPTDESVTLGDIIATVDATLGDVAVGIEELEDRDQVEYTVTETKIIVNNTSTGKDS